MPPELGELSLRIEVDHYWTGFTVIKSRPLAGTTLPFEGRAHCRTLSGAKRLVWREERKEWRRLKRLAKNRERLLRGL